MVTEISIQQINGIEFGIKKIDKPYTYSLRQLAKLNAQFCVPTVCLIGEEYHLVNHHREVKAMIEVGIKTVKVLILQNITLTQFKIIRLTLSNINLEFDPIVCSEAIRDLTRIEKIKNISHTIGVDKDLFDAYEVLLDFDWGFKSKAENKKQVSKDPDQIDLWNT